MTRTNRKGSMAGPKHDLILDIEETFVSAFQDAPAAQRKDVWGWWEKLTADDHLRQVDLMRLKGLLQAVVVAYRKAWEEESEADQKSPDSPFWPLKVLVAGQPKGEITKRSGGGFNWYRNNGAVEQFTRSRSLHDVAHAIAAACLAPPEQVKLEEPARKQED